MEQGRQPPDPVAHAGMLIRKPVAEVFEAFIDPAITRRFWFSKGSGRLAPGARVRWEWEMYGVGADVVVKAIEANRRILIDWDEPNPTEVEWTFEARGANCWIEVENRGFKGDLAEKVKKALDSKGGFELVLAGAKIWLEHGLEPRFVLDHAPHALVESWRD